MNIKCIVDLSIHLFLTLAASVYIFFKTGNIYYIVFFSIGSILVDLDHLIDYWSYFKNHFNLKSFLNSEQLNSGKVYLFLHSWEICFILLLIALVVKIESLLFLVLGLGMHLVVDNIQRKNPFFYLLIYRYREGFNRDILLPEFKNHTLKNREL